METNTTGKGVYHVSYGNSCTQGKEENLSSDYTPLGEREAHMYESIDIDQSDGGRYTEIDKNVSNNSKPCRVKDVYFCILLAIIILLVISLVVIVYHLVTCTSKAGSCGLPDIPSHGSIAYITGTSFPARASLKCDDGFKVRGNSLIKCQANGRWTNGTVCIKKDSDCLDLLNEQNIREDGVYSITTWKTRQITQVYCDMSTNGGGWTVFQHRFDGSIEFYRNFSEYENGFGNLSTEFWLGLRYIHEITSQEDNELRIDLEAFNGTRAYETFSRFFLGQGPDYTLHVGETIESLHISDEKRFGSYHNGCKFSTLNHDEDSFEGSCAEAFRGGWWYRDCLSANLNGLYLPPGTQDAKGMVYLSFLPNWTLKSSKIMMRRETGIT